MISVAWCCVPGLQGPSPAWKEGMEGGKRRHLEPGAELDALKFKVPPQLILKTGVCVRTNFLLREKKAPRG